MRTVLAATLAVLALPAAGVAQSAPPAAQAASPSAPASCVPRQSPLGGIGRASVVAFTSPVFGAPVCATVANLVNDAFTAQVAQTPSAGALVTAALTGGGGVALALEGATVSGAGPYVISPGGVIPDFGGETAEAPRVVLAYAGARVLVIGTTAIALVDLAKELRAHPDVFGADAIERAVLLASGPNAALSVRADDGVIGVPTVTTSKVLLLIKRG